MDIIEAIETRHSVRQYLDKKIQEDILAELRKEIEICNQEAKLHIQIFPDEKETFRGMLAHYGKFDGVQNYIALIGRKERNLNEKLGYYGERIALKAQQLGLNTCWVALTFNKSKCKAKINPGEKMVCVLALGYGKTQGVPHKSKDIKELYQCDGVMPEWFQKGVESALLAPTAKNQQRFVALFQDGVARVNKTTGFYADVDLGIVKYHFEAGSGKRIFQL